MKYICVLIILVSFNIFAESSDDDCNTNGSPVVPNLNDLSKVSAISGGKVSPLNRCLDQVGKLLSGVTKTLTELNPGDKKPLSIVLSNFKASSSSEATVQSRGIKDGKEFGLVTGTFKVPAKDCELKANQMVTFKLKGSGGTLTITQTADKTFKAEAFPWSGHFRLN